MIANDEDLSKIIYYKELKTKKPISRDEERALWLDYKNNGNIESRNKIIESNLRFVASIAKRYLGRGLSYQELVAAGNDGLLKAIENFNGNKGFKFISYGVWWIKDSIITELEKKDKLSCDEMPQYYENTDDNDNVDYNEPVVPEDVIVNEMDNFDKDTYFKNIIKDTMVNLNEREKEIIERVFGINGYEEETLEEIGKSLGITKERVRQIKERCMIEMRSQIMKNNNLALFIRR